MTRLALWCTHGQDRRTSSDLEGLDSAVADDLKKTKTNLWSYTEGLQGSSASREALLSQVLNPHYVSPSKDEKLLKRETEAESLTEKYPVEKSTDAKQLVVAASKPLYRPK